MRFALHARPYAYSTCTEPDNAVYYEQLDQHPAAMRPMF